MANDASLPTAEFVVQSAGDRRGGRIEVAGSGEVLGKLREICLKFPEVTEGLSWGHPTFKAGKKDFVVLDEYHPTLCIAFKAGLSTKEALLEGPRFFSAHFCV
jgi:hypothetical protein